MKKKWRARTYMKNGAVIEFIYDQHEDSFSSPWVAFKLDREIVATVLRSEIVAIVYETLPEEDDDGEATRTDD